jgi:hypothetical protein
MSAKSPNREVAEQVHAVRFFSLTRGVAGFGGDQFLTAFNAGAYVEPPSIPSGMSGGGFTVSNATMNVSFGCTSYAGAHQYDPEFVAEILAADAAEPQASFNNVVDMLDWLNRD